jgi:CRP-like cAMP-binding protein
MRDMIEFQWERTKFFDTDAVLEILPTPLRTQVLLDMNKTFMFTVPFFQDQDEAIIKEIVQVLGHELILPGTLVVHEGQPADKMFFTRFGRFEVLAPHSFVVVQSIGIGGYFGEIGLLVNHGRYSATVRASPTTRCEVATLSRANLDKLMNTFPVFSRSFKRVGLSRLRSTRNDFLKSRFSGQTEYRIVFEIIKGHNLMPDEDQGVVMAEVVTRTCKKKRKNDNQNQKDGGDGGDGGNPSEDYGHRQIGRAHRTDRRRGNSPYFGNVFVIEICCHEMQRIESLEFLITLYQCHSWRPRTYIGSFKVHPVDIRLGQVTKQWYRLKNMETPSECDVIMSACASERQGRKKKKKKNPMGQILLRMLRHRDSGGRDAQLRASQGIRELSKAAKHDTSMTAAHSAALSRQESVLQARATKKTRGDKSGAGKDEGTGVTKKKSWKNIKKKFLTAGHLKQEFDDGLRFGAQMTMLDTFSSALKKRREGAAECGGGGAGGDTARSGGSGGGNSMASMASKDSRESMDRSIGQCGKLCDIGERLRENLVVMAQKQQEVVDTIAAAPPGDGGENAPPSEEVPPPSEEAPAAE